MNRCSSPSLPASYFDIKINRGCFAASLAFTRLFCGLWLAWLSAGLGIAQPPSRPASPLWERSNLVAWCVVHFDSQRRDATELAQMLQRLGITKLAYDYRPTDLAGLEAEIAELNKHGIELFAIWFPPTLDAEAEKLIELLEKCQQRPQLWVRGGGSLAMTADEEAAFLEAEVARLTPIVEAAKRLGVKVGLYNHGQWFGEPENQLRLIQRLPKPHVGIVYNLHHGHAHLDRFPQLLQQLRPHLLALNLNGMRTDGDRMGHKILPIGEGDRDRELLGAIAASGYQGPIGILNHTSEDAGLRLQDNLDGLAWCVKSFAGDKNLELSKPGWRSFRGVATYQPSLPKELAAASRDADVGHGLRVFASPTAGCVACHAIGQYGGKVGPELTAIGQKRTPEHIVTSLLWPHREVEAAYQSFHWLLDDGQILHGIKVEKDAEHFVVRDPATGKERLVAKSSVEEERLAGSVMPETLVTSMPYRDQLALFAFVSGLGTDRGLAGDVLESVLKHSRGHRVATFDFQAGPLRSEYHPLHTEPVNRDRVYDFYAKQAQHFRTQDREAELLMEYPGLDGKNFGHWGNQDEAYWAGDEANAAVRGPFVSHVFKHGKQVIARGVCVRLAGTDEGYAVFDTDRLQFDARWAGGYAYSSVRHGFVDGVRPQSDRVESIEPVEHAGPTRYLGFYRFDEQTVFSYLVGDVEYLDSAAVVDQRWTRTRLPAAEHPLRGCKAGGGLVDSPRLTVEVELGAEDEFAIDTIPMPSDNSWQAPLFGGDLDVASDGSLYVCTMHGDVWHVDGFQAAGSRQATWTRFATGLHQPLGLVVHHDQCYVLGRNQITRLHDLNRDGQADWYECFSRAMTTSAAGHDFICGLQRDAAGNFYTASGNQGLLKIAPDGQSLEVLATGFRNPDGLGLLPDGSLTIPCSEGDWTPASMICLRTPQQAGIPFYGHRGPSIGGRPVLPLIYLPRGLDNSSGGQVPISSHLWEGLQGNLIHLSHGTGTAMQLMIDRVGDQHQGAVMVLPGDFRSGVHRGRFSPWDGQLYVVGMTGWGSYAPDHGCLQRMRYVDRQRLRPVAFHVHENGIALRLSHPLPADSDLSGKLLDREQYFAQAWNYRYGPGYGSAEYSTQHPGVRGHDRFPVAAVHYLEKEQTLFIDLPDLQPVNQLHLHVADVAGHPWDIFATIHRLDRPRSDLPNYLPRVKSIAPHPIEQDLLNALRKKPNPFRKRLKDAREVVLEAGQNLSFSTREIRVAAGEAIALRFRNPDVVPHNWALLRPGKLASVGEMVNRLISDPDAAYRNYIPDSDDILCYTDIVEGQDEMTIYFVAPSTPGVYPYLCTFPGHWMVMNGELIVE
jgi:putative heme-binding domain-containing protein